MRLAIAATGCLARNQAHKHLELFRHRALVQHGLVQLHEGAHDVRTTRHRLDTVRRESARFPVVDEARLDVFGHGVEIERTQVGHDVILVD